MNKLLLHPLAKPLLLALALGPLAALVTGAVQGTLGANPAETLIRSTGEMALRLLCVTLAVTPLRQATGWHALARLRRGAGLLAFLYALLHFTAYAWLDMGFDVAAVIADIPRRPFVLVGTATLLLMLPLAATSFDRAVRALGGARWRALHRAVYAIALLALLHFFWMRAGKNDFGEWSVYAAIVAVLLGWRLRARWRAGARA